MNHPLLTAGSERRAAPRKVLRTSVEVSLPGGTALSARSVDINPTGMGFVCNVNLPAKSPCAVAFSLKLNGRAFHIALRGTVAFTVLSAQQGGFIVGMKFDLVPAEVSALIKRYMNT